MDTYTMSYYILYMYHFPFFFFFFFNPFYVHRSEYAQVRDEQANLSSNSDVNAIVHQSVNSLSTMSRMFN